MLKLKYKSLYLITLSTMSLLIASDGIATTLSKQAKMTIKKDSRHDVSLPLRYLQALSNATVLSNHIERFYPSQSIREILSEETLNNTTAIRLIHLTAFQGMGVGLGNYQVTSPEPDVNGSVGMTQYVQYVNSDLAVFDKATGQVAAGFPKPANSIWAGFGGACEAHAAGRMTVKYDHLANRWVISQYANVDNTLGPFFYCVAVSTTEDATGSYNRYAFSQDSFSNFARLGLWPDAYYASFNFMGQLSTGPAVCALERNKMVHGDPARSICFHLATQLSEPVLPADLEGNTKPPNGNPEYFMSLNAPDAILLFKFHVDFTFPAQSTLATVNIPVDSFMLSCIATKGSACAVQPDTANRLDIQSDRLMTRLSYRQFSDHGSMVVNHTVEGPQPKFAPAVRWYEFRVMNNSSTFNPIVYQQSTLTPNSMNRFAGSVAMDMAGNMAVGYTVSSALVHPSPEFAYRTASDDLNTLTIQPLVTGTGSQINNVTAWTSTSKMSIDPVDQCTFWYTSEYLKTTGSMNWSTYILNFKLPGC